MPALLMMIMNNPAMMAGLTSIISNPALVQTITSILSGLSNQVAAGVPPATAMQNLILTQFDLDQAAGAVKAEVAKLGLTPWTLDQEREMAAVVIRNYISNVKAGK